MAHWWLEKPIAHRGFHNHSLGIPENSLLSFEKAIEKNYAIELDVHYLKDGTPVVFHDKTLERMTNVQGKIKDLMPEHLIHLRLMKTDQKIPTLYEVLKLVDGKVPLLIELKVESGDVPRPKDGLLDLLGRYKGEFAIQCFHPHTIKWLAKNRKSWKRGLLTYDWVDSDLKELQKFALRNMFYFPLTRPHFVAVEYNAVELLSIKLLRSWFRTEIITWTVKEKSLFEKFKAEGIGCIFENFEP